MYIAIAIHNQNGSCIKLSNVDLIISTFGAAKIMWGNKFQSLMTLCEKLVLPIVVCITLMFITCWR